MEFDEQPITENKNVILSGGSNMFIICYELDGENTWEMVSGEDAMQIRVDELMEELDCEAEDIMVFDKDTEL